MPSPVYLGDTEVYAAAALAPAAGAAVLTTSPIGRTALYSAKVNLSLSQGVPVAADFANYAVKRYNGQMLWQLLAGVYQEFERVLLHQNERLQVVALGPGTGGVIVGAQIILTPQDQPQW